MLAVKYPDVEHPVMQDEIEEAHDKHEVELTA